MDTLTQLEAELATMTAERDKLAGLLASIRFNTRQWLVVAGRAERKNEPMIMIGEMISGMEKIVTKIDAALAGTVVP